LVLLEGAAQAQTPVSIELVLALDASASVDREEFQLQLDGLTAAFRDEEVLQAIENLKPLGAAVAVVQWGGPGETRIVIPFTHLEGGRDAKAFGFIVGLVRRWTRASSTSIATAIDDSRAILQGNAFEGLRMVIDVSGDGVNNSGADLREARRAAEVAGITVNGLPIIADDASLADYYAHNVIAGSDAFVEPARDFEDFARAIKEKLLRELRPLGS
jgi:hypothetical protein